MLNEVEDAFTMTKGKHTGKHFACVNVKEDEVIKIGDSLVEESGEKYLIMDVEWFTPSWIEDGFRRVGLMLDKPIERNKHVRIEKLNEG